MIIGLPSGIGDVSWAYSKLRNAGPMVYEVADGWPHRTKPFLDLLPDVQACSYGAFNYADVIDFENATGIGYNPTWEDITKRGYGRVLIEPNRHLETGKRLEDWCPDLPTSFHYTISIPTEDVIRARGKLGTAPRPWTGVSAASYRGSEAWKTWGYPEWSDFLKRWDAEVGGTIFLLGGFWDDLTDALADDGYKSLVGRTSAGTVVEILRLLDFYIGFSSGLGVIRTVLKKSAFCLWPEFQAELSTSWAPPEMIENGTYVAELWRKPELVFKRARGWAKRCS